MMGDKQRKLRKWFQRHKWKTSDTPTGHGFWLSSPIENCAGNNGTTGASPITISPASMMPSVMWNWKFPFMVFLEAVKRTGFIQIQRNGDNNYETLLAMRFTPGA